MEFELVEMTVYSGYRILMELNRVKSNHIEYSQQNTDSNLLFRCLEDIDISFKSHSGDSEKAISSVGLKRSKEQENDSFFC